MRLFPSWLTRQAPTTTRDSTDLAPGTCEICGQNAIIWLDGRNFFCWEHYTEKMQEKRT